MTSTSNDIRAVIESRIAAEMSKLPAYPVNYQNTPFTPPNTTPWLQAFIRFGDSAYATLLEPTPGFNRQNGTLSINVFTSVGVGAAANFAIAERVKSLFDRQTVDGVTFDSAVGPASVSANVTETGASASSGLAATYFQTQLTITFQAYLS
jgi:hypothetical protein